MIFNSTLTENLKYVMQGVQVYIGQEFSKKILKFHKRQKIFDRIKSFKILLCLRFSLKHLKLVGTPCISTSGLRGVIFVDFQCFYFFFQG